MDSISNSLLLKLIRIDKESRSYYDKIKAIFAMLDLYMEQLLESEQLHFTTLFTKISYLCLKFKISKRLVFFSHIHRKQIELLDKNNSNEEKYQIAKYVLIGLIQEIEQITLSGKIKELYVVPNYKEKIQKLGVDSLNFARIHVFSCNAEDDVLVGFNESSPEAEIQIRLNVIGKNDDYNSLLRFIKRRNKFPFILHLEQIEILEDESYLPNKIVFEPDFLVDITTISECFKPNESNPLFYFIKKFIPVIQNKYLIIGNTANYFLDELFNDPEVTFKSLLKNTFKLSPLGFAMMDDNEIKDVISTLKKHFYSIRDTILNQFSIHNINQSNSFLEPSFYAPKYGIQGRLDLFTSIENSNEAKIIELKSGKPFKANSYGLNINHYVQTLLYDLLLDSVNEGKLKISSFILYSSQNSDSLRFAPPIKLQQKEAIKLRNQLVEIDYLLADVDVQNDQIFNYINSEYIKSDGFAKRDIEVFQNAYSSIGGLTKKYFNAFCGFVAREQILSKTGEYGLERNSGLAGLWLDEMNEKIENFRVLNALDIVEIKSEKDHTNLQFRRTSQTAINANFRIGDLGVLYPYNAGNESVLRNQIFKCSIIELDSEYVKVRLRNKQNSILVFEGKVQWHLEHDHLDHGFNTMYQELFRFINTSKDFQEMILGRKAPLQPLKTKDLEIDREVMTFEQDKVLKEMINATQYYLLWGPPGTGKTSIMLYHYLKYHFFNSEDKILVLAYTNRAVDEICEAISRIGNGITNKYFRIGSRYSTNEKFVNDLLVTKLQDIDNRNELLDLLQNSKIIVSTVASIQGKKEIFSLININTIIVDEASQILEPQLVGLLSYAQKFILIGDHNQLPAIVLQREDESRVEDTQLISIRLNDRRNSLFERMYKRCLDRNWYWAIGKLTQQGRMNKQIMDFVNDHFYNGILSIIPNIERLDEKTKLYKQSNTGFEILSKDRMIYIPTLIDEDSITFKTNNDEATKTALLVKSILELFEINKIKYSENKLGVITPYRAQISAILSAINELGIKERINVDTVERYQGGAKDIIILSMCLNIESQLKQLVNLSEDGIDRKINVALTRSREQIIVLGNEGIMNKNEVYRKIVLKSKRFEI